MKFSEEPVYRLEPTEWEMVYPVHVDPIGRIKRRRAGYEAKCGDENLGIFPSGDAAAEAIWSRFLEQNNVRHEMASHTHGGYDRHKGT